MKRILFATDFSESCGNAFNYLKMLIKDSEVIVDIIHVYDIPVTTYATAIPPNAVQGIIEEKNKASVRRLNEVRNQLSDSQKGNIHPTSGQYPSIEIAELADKIDADLIVMALRKKYNLVNKLIGSVTVHTIHNTIKPVLAIPNGINFRPIKEILFPTEMELNEKVPTSVFNTLDKLFAFCDFLQSPNLHMIHISTKDSSKAMDIVFKNFPFKSIDFTVSAAKSAEEGILKQLETGSIDLLAMYKPHRTVWERVYHSSVTRKLLYKSKLPLLIFP